MPEQVQEWFGWEEFHANVLFTGAGVLNLVCAAIMAYVTSPRGGVEGAPQRVADLHLLVASLVMAPLGWLLMVPPSSYDGAWPQMSVAQFLGGFGLVTVAFPFGRGVCLSMVGKLLGDRPQGTWMGITFALGALARIAGPFWAVHGYQSLGALVVFGGTAALYGLSLVGVRLLGSTISTDGVGVGGSGGGGRELLGQTPSKPQGPWGGGGGGGGGGASGGELERRASITSSPVCDPRPGSSSMAQYHMSPALVADT